MAVNSARVRRECKDAMTPSAEHIQYPILVVLLKQLADLCFFNGSMHSSYKTQHSFPEGSVSAVTHLCSDLLSRRRVAL